MVPGRVRGAALDGPETPGREDRPRRWEAFELRRGVAVVRGVCGVVDGRAVRARALELEDPGGQVIVGGVVSSVTLAALAVAHVRGVPVVEDGGDAFDVFPQVAWFVSGQEAISQSWFASDTRVETGVFSSTVTASVGSAVDVSGTKKDPQRRTIVNLATWRHSAPSTPSLPSPEFRDLRMLRIA
jgi:hypothetical protein